jgi:hypothetical protein
MTRRSRWTSIRSRSWGKATTDTRRPQSRTELGRSAEVRPRAEHRPSRRLGSTADGPVTSPQDAPARPKAHADSFPRRGRYLDEDASFTYAHYRSPDGEHRRHEAQNLMWRPFLGDDRLNGPKRLWYEADRDAHGQMVAIRGSRFVRSW